MEFLRLLLDEYDHSYTFVMPEGIRQNSSLYLEENDGFLKFVDERVVADEEGWFTLKSAKEAFKRRIGVHLVAYLLARSKSSHLIYRVSNFARGASLAVF
ncbi:hypothetical protein TSOC_014106 [Tetrabaena socialis]|uniref:Uncharacterized protein n=1 Tax=Tetrabaena socialis TaxID=47790 RepID=A0A2J7ZIM4_9CHLO|nr:hypothetical protein TSOC_014106 [Tetrabaena socialis]|eukprot:PNH00121.1 hypothetical protein TSOC_014106 [Tetrabaena socialis]